MHFFFLDLIPNFKPHLSLDNQITGDVQDISDSLYSSETSQTSSPWKTYQSLSTGEVLCLCIMWPNLSLTHTAQPKLPLSHILFNQYLNSCDIQCFKSVGAPSPQSNHCIFSNKVLSSKMCPTHSFLGSCKLTVPREAESPISTVTYIHILSNK